MNWNPTPEQLERITGASALPLFGPAVMLGVPDADYRDVGGVSQSFLKLMHPRPGNACAFFSGGDKPEFRIGRFTHQAILTPHDPLPLFVVSPEFLNVHTSGPKAGQPWAWHGGRNECKAWVAKYEAAGKIVFGPEEYRAWSNTIRSLAANETCGKLFGEGNAEVSCFAKMEVDGVEFVAKCRIDWVPKYGNALADIKTTRHGGSDARDFNKLVKWGGYGFQAAWCMMIWNLTNPNDQRSEFVWVVVEKEEPYVIQFYYADRDSLYPHRVAVKDRLRVFAESLRSGVFAGDSEIFQRIEA